MPTLLGNLRFSRRRCWRFKSSGILRCLDWQIFTEVTKNHTSSPAVHQAWHNSLLGMQSISHLAWNVRIRRQMSQMFPCPQAFTQQLAHPQFLYTLCTTCSWHLPSISNCICECSTLPALCTLLQSHAIQHVHSVIHHLRNISSSFCILALASVSVGLYLYRGADKSLARPGIKQARKHVRDARDFNNIETRAVIKFFCFLQGNAPKEIHAILTETLACFLPGRAKDLSAPQYIISSESFNSTYILCLLDRASSW